MMKANAAPTPELAQVLRRYLQIQAEEQKLKEEKASLQEKLAQHMTANDLKHWFPEVDNLALKIRCQQDVAVEYDEPALKERLGARFRSILAPDWRKIRRHLADLQSTLDPMLETIGSPTPDRVRFAIEQGIVKKEEFAGAFKKTTRRTVAVSRVTQPAGEAEF
jgi:hypothetical protein